MQYVGRNAMWRQREDGVLDILCGVPKVLVYFKGTLCVDLFDVIPSIKVFEVY